jgi:hypothetical protein
LGKKVKKALYLAVYAVAMAYLEAAVVVYLRKIYYPGDLLTLFPLRIWAPEDLALELGREAATAIMILAVALLSERRVTRRFASFVFIFGIWDIFYYFFLKVLLGWPVRWLEWDILFLIPWMWLGPWIAPSMVALLFTLWGGWVIVKDPPLRWGGLSWLLFLIGCLIVLTTFLQPAFSLLGADEEMISAFRPPRFWWEAYLAGLFTMIISLMLTLRLPGRVGIPQTPVRGEDK